MDQDAYLDVLPTGRRDAVAAWLLTTVGDCATCGAPVRITQGRVTEKSGGYKHISCEPAPATAPAPVEEPTSPAIAARARRSDWG